MRPFTRTIIDLFDSKRRYLIPLYQRQYAWKVAPQLELLWEDIERCALHLEGEGVLKAPHFMGAIVISQIKTFGKQVQAYEVIDGQQRLTTFQLLLAAFRDVARTHSPEYEAEVGKHLLNDGVMEAAEVERFKLWPSLTDRGVFTRIVDPEGIGAAAKDVLDDDEISTPLAGMAHAYFKDRILRHVCRDDGFDAFRMEKLFEALKDGLAVVSIELEGGDDPQTIFETLNSRGVDLSAGDLMRNFIFQRAVGMGQEQGSLKVDELYRQYWLSLDRGFWRQLETRGRLSRPRLDWMLVDHLTMQKADLVSAEGLYEAYRRWIIEETPYPDVLSELKSITASANAYRRIVQQDKTDPLGKFGRFSRAFDVSTTMPLVLFLATERDIGPRLPAALHLLESYIVRRDLCGLTNKNFNRLFVDAIAKLRATDGDVVAHLETFLGSGRLDTSRWPADEEWSQGWISRSQYGNARQARLRYIFEALEACKSTAANEVLEIKSDLTVEHIMPVKWREHWPIPRTPGLPEEEFDLDQMVAEGERDGKIHTLGNLTLLTQTLNSTVSNGPFETKMPALRAQSALALNRELQAFDHWDENTIIARGAALFRTAKLIWSGPPASGG